MKSVLAILAAGGAAQSPGNGISKSTYSCNDPLPAKEFLFKYFPVDTPGDECPGDICTCPAAGGVPEWTIQQGRVYTKQGSAVDVQGRRLPPAGNGFGLHCVNVSRHLTTGGMSTAQVEAQFASKLGDMTAFDSFMDFSVTFHTSDLADYATAFDRDSVPYYGATWRSAPDSAAHTYTSLIVQVPNTMMVIELVSEGALSGSRRPVHASPPHERRASPRALALLEELAAQQSSIGSIITPISVNRAVSGAVLAKLDDFYVAGMGTTKVSHDFDEASGYTRQCYLWPGSKVDVCFTNRPDDATKGSWKVSDFEDMLNTVHKNIIVGDPFCGVDKWGDLHYAIDSFTADTAGIIAYVNKNNVPHYCESGGGSGTGSDMHYVFDPTGWGIQTDLSFPYPPQDCSVGSGQYFQPPGGGGNPACEPGTCKSEDVYV